MSAPKYINANDFIETLKSHGLVIVSIREFEAGKDLLRKKLMRRKALSLKEIADNKLLPVKDKKTVNDWILNGKIKPTETYQEANGCKRIMVLTSAIRRLGYED
jgi:hypothetical protein